MIPSNCKIGDRVVIHGKDYFIEKLKIHEYYFEHTIFDAMYSCFGKIGIITHRTDYNIRVMMEDETIPRSWWWSEKCFSKYNKDKFDIKDLKIEF